MDTDPYFVTQDNGAGAPVHFATTYKQLDMVRRNKIAGAEKPRLFQFFSIIPCHILTQSFNSLSLQLHHLLNNGAEVNQRDEKGLTPLHRAAYLAHYDGYLEIYEYLLVSSVSFEVNIITLQQLIMIC
jgi:[acyl-carrier-protein] S-malonyltransferase